MRNWMANLSIHGAALFKNAVVKRISVLLAAAFLLFTSTACNPPAPRVVGEGSYDKKIGQQTELYDPIQKRVGGMNEYNDDLSLDRGRQQDKAKSLVQNARENLRDRATNPKELLENAKDGRPIESSKEVADRVSRRVENLRDDVVEGTEKGTRNLKANLKDAGRSVKKMTEDNAQNLEQGSKRFYRDAKRSVESAADTAKSAGQEGRYYSKEVR